MPHHKPSDVGYICRLGAFKYAVRGVLRGRTDDEILARMSERFGPCSPETLRAVLDIAEAAVAAAVKLRSLGPGEYLDPTELPIIPR